MKFGLVLYNDALRYEEIGPLRSYVYIPTFGILVYYIYIPPGVRSYDSRKVDIPS